MKKKIKFPDFWYESNACWGWVRSIEDLQEKCDLQLDKSFGTFHSKGEFLDNSRQHHNGSMEFGTRGEHTGKKTLREFLIEYKIEF